MNLSRWRISVEGLVQGIGFRPFVYRLAHELNLTGWVQNSPAGATIEVEGTLTKLNHFLSRLKGEIPSTGCIKSLNYFSIPQEFDSLFKIVSSQQGQERSAIISPDLATCGECLRELFDPQNRRYRYPFTNCTQCGPRMSIIQNLPYDRRSTTMNKFQMCKECLSEFSNPLDRRFHAQPNCCPQCGPQITLWDKEGHTQEIHWNAILKARELLCLGKILAIKGIGGFHLLVDATNPEAIRELRIRKNRMEKPFAIMPPSLQWVHHHCQITPQEEQILKEAGAPIVLIPSKTTFHPLSSKDEKEISPEVAPNNPYLGILLPYSPLHHLLMAELGFPVVATSGNLSEEPICTDEYQALQNLGKVADYFLVHNRPISCPLDDSVVRVMDQRRMFIRRSRGYSPYVIDREPSLPHSIGLGAQQKSTFSLSIGTKIIVSPYIGDLEHTATQAVYEKNLNLFQQIYSQPLAYAACDLHPNYFTTQLATQLKEKMNVPTLPVQHHYAHVLSCMAEHGIKPPLLGVAWDGNGLGTDHTLWGGEFLWIESHQFKRLAHFKPFPLPGSEKAMREPRRSALGVLYAIFGEKVLDLKPSATIQSFSSTELFNLTQMLKTQFNSPITSSVGRLFDAVASLLGMKQKASFEGQAAMELEFKTHEALSTENQNVYGYSISHEESNQDLTCLSINWDSIILGILEDLELSKPISVISLQFHNTLAHLISDIAQKVDAKKVVLTGGCFQNRVLLERSVKLLRQNGRAPYYSQHIPPNDSGISLGQILAVDFAKG